MSRINLKRIFLVAVALLLAACCATASAETVRLSVQGFAEKTMNLELRRVDRPVITAFSEANPNIKLNLSGKIPYRSTRTLLKELEEHKLTSDVFAVTTEYHDLVNVLSSGYCLDLTDHADIAALLSEMHPAIAAAAYRDGRIYGVPTEVSTRQNLFYDQDAWALAGYSGADVPTSFTALLDFLEGWIERIRVNPVENVCVTNAFSKDSISGNSYTLWLLEILLRSYVYQCEVTGTTPSFDDPTLLPLLERVKNIGAELLAYDDFRHAKASLFVYVSNAPQLIPRLIPTRLTENDPLFIPATVTLACVRADSKNPDMAQAFIAHYARWMHEHTTDAYGLLEHFHDENGTYTDDDHWAELGKALLFRDAVGPVHSLNVDAVTDIPRMIANYQKALEEEKSEERRAKIQSDLNILTSSEFKEVRSRYALDFTEDELSAYQLMAQYLFFVSPDLFDLSSKNVTNVCAQYANGALTGRELAQKLSEFAAR